MKFFTMNKNIPKELLLMKINNKIIIFKINLKYSKQNFLIK